jgi:hypothetical protein
LLFYEKKIKCKCFLKEKFMEKENIKKIFRRFVKEAEIIDINLNSI